MLEQVHALALDHVEVGLQGLGIALQGIHHHPIEVIADLAFKQAAGAPFPGIEPLGQFSHRALLGLRAVHQLVGAATPDVDRPDRPALGRGHQQGAQVEGFGPLGRFLPAGLIGLIQL